MTSCPFTPGRRAPLRSKDATVRRGRRARYVSGKWNETVERCRAWGEEIGPASKEAASLER